MKKQSDALVYLWKKYYESQPDKIAALERERIKAQVAHIIYTLRKELGLTQKQLAKLVKTKVSVISRLEDADYDKIIR